MNAIKSYTFGIYLRGIVLISNHGLNLKCTSEMAVDVLYHQTGTSLDFVYKCERCLCSDSWLNTLQRNIHNSVSSLSFKCALDKFLSTVPDEPLIPGYTSMRRAKTNSLVDMANFGDFTFQVTEDGGWVLEH